MAATATQQEWIERVLGIGAATAPAAAANTPAAADAAAPPPPRPVGPVMPVWRDAKEAVDAQIETLARNLRSYGHPDLNRIADLGLFGIGTRETVGLMRARMQFDAAPAGGKAPAAKALRSAIAAWRGLLGGNQTIALIDANPESPVTMRATLGGALDDIDSILDRAA